MADRYGKDNVILGRFINEADADANLIRLKQADPNAKKIKDGKSWIIIGNAVLSSRPVIISKI